MCRSKTEAPPNGRRCPNRQPATTNRRGDAEGHLQSARLDLANATRSGDRREAANARRRINRWQGRITT